MTILPKVIGCELIKLLEQYYINHSEEIQRQLLTEVTKLSSELVYWIKGKMEKSINNGEKLS